MTIKLPEFDLRPFRWALLLAAALTMLAGCQSNQKPYVAEAIKVPGNAKIFVYWPSSTWREKAGNAPEIQLNGVPVGLLTYKSYIELEVPAGTYELRMTGDSEDAKWEGPDQAFTTPIAAGEMKYVRLLVKYDQQTNTLGHGLLDYAVLFLPRAETEARKEMYGLKRVEDQ